MEALRQPLESGRVTVARANAHVSYPARVQLVAAMNPCKCGYLGDARMGCGRAPKCGADYQARISGPLFDRIDLHVAVPAVNPADLSLPPPRETSATVAARVAEARARQATRFANLAPGRTLRCNAEADGALLEQWMPTEATARHLLVEAAERLHLSARGFHRVLKVARTLADLAGSDAIGRIHIAEALSYRRIGLGLDSGLADRAPQSLPVALPAAWPAPNAATTGE